MDNQKLYSQLAYQTSGRVTAAYSTSFSLAITLVDKSMRAHIYAVYGLVRLADEVVDSFRPHDSRQLLEKLEHEVYAALESGYSTNLLIHSFATTAKTYNFELGLIRAFFASMRMDITKTNYTQREYEDYIYGSAEVIGLMCLHVFTDNDSSLYSRLQPSARALGAAFQKINFLRDMAADHNQLGRMYFPNVVFDKMSQKNKKDIIADISKDIRKARRGLVSLPKSSRYAVLLALYYYEALIKQLKKAPVETVKTRRLRISNTHKLWLYVLVRIQKTFNV
ncbi:MAG: phytoene/squalene synthase family protein [Candidatus Saccharibacteria bacterium]